MLSTAEWMVPVLLMLQLRLLVEMGGRDGEFWVGDQSAVAGGPRAAPRTSLEAMTGRPSWWESLVGFAHLQPPGERACVGMSPRSN